MTAALRFDPAAFADPFAEAGNVVIAALRAVRIEGARKAAITTFPASANGSANAAGSKRRAAVILSLNFGTGEYSRYQRDATSGHNSSAPRAAMRLPSSTA